MDFRPQRATTDDFQQRHEYLSTSPESMFVRTCSVQRRDATGVDMLTGCVLKRIGYKAAGPRTLDTAQEWFDALNDIFDLPLTDLTRNQREALWARVSAAHERWLAQYSRYARQT
jgi:arylamine N-acetyltransferase